MRPILRGVDAHPAISRGFILGLDAAGSHQRNLFGAIACGVRERGLSCLDRVTVTIAAAIAVMGEARLNEARTECCIHYFYFINDLRVAYETSLWTRDETVICCNQRDECGKMIRLCRFKSIRYSAAAVDSH